MIYIVTGVSGGIGKAIVEQLLSNQQRVIGIGRTNFIVHPNFQFIRVDLQDREKINSLLFQFGNEDVILINNAGILGNLKRLSDQTELDIEEVLSVNTIAPFLLALHVYKQMKDKSKFTLVNISSGAAQRPIPSWAAYCASKVALNMLSEAFYLEEKEKGIDLRVYSIAPGIVDTAMQDYIRSASVEDFSGVNRFKELKEQDELWQADEVARRILLLLNMPFTGTVVSDLRNL